MPTEFDLSGHCFATGKETKDGCGTTCMRRSLHDGACEFERDDEITFVPLDDDEDDAITQVMPAPPVHS
jgi:hypothetical protein